MEGVLYQSKMNKTHPMKTDSDLGRMAYQLVADCKVGLMTTASAEGQPHATWMNFETKGYLDEIFTITAPITQKVANIRENPRTEWLFSNPSMERVVLVCGNTRVIEGPDMKPYWDAVPGKSKAYYREYANPQEADHFVVLCTTVGKIVLNRPSMYRKFTVKEENAANPHSVFCLPDTPAS